MKLSTINGVKYVSSNDLAEFTGKPTRYVTRQVRDKIARETYQEYINPTDFIIVQGDSSLRGRTPMVYLIGERLANDYALSARPVSKRREILDEVRRLFKEDKES